MKFKENVKIFGIRPELTIAMNVVESIYYELGNHNNCVCTSVRDGKHKRGSDHYNGCAFDMRVWGFKGITLDIKPIVDYSGQEVADIIKARLTDEFEVFFEGDHIHIGLDPQNL